jgi:hypothetical protein
MFYNPQTNHIINNNNENNNNNSNNNYNNNSNQHNNLFKNVSPEMLNYGINAGQDMIARQRDKYMPGLSVFWQSLRYYFAVIILNIFISITSLCMYIRLNFIN